MLVARIRICAHVYIECRYFRCLRCWRPLWLPSCFSPRSRTRRDALQTLRRWQSEQLCATRRRSCVRWAIARSPSSWWRTSRPASWTWLLSDSHRRRSHSWWRSALRTTTRSCWTRHSLTERSTAFWCSAFSARTAHFHSLSLSSRSRGGFSLLTFRLVPSCSSLTSLQTLSRKQSLLSFQRSVSEKCFLIFGFSLSWKDCSWACDIVLLKGKSPLLWLFLWKTSTNTLNFIQNFT